MFRLLWKYRASAGVIDCDIDEAQQTIVLGDAAGGVTLLDWNGGVISQTELGGPVWGVSHAYDAAGRLWIAAAIGNKKPRHGIATILRDFSVVAEHRLDRACWDSRVDLAGSRAIFSTWANTLLDVDLANPNGRAYSAPLPAPAYGLAGFSPGVLLVNVAGHGFFTYELSTRHVTLHLSVKGNCYNVVHSHDDSSRIASGSSMGKVILAARGAPKLLPMADAQVTAVVFAGPFLIAGDLGGEIRCFLPAAPHDPISTLSATSGVWHIAYSTRDSLVLLTTATGEVECLHLELEDYQPQAIPRFLASAQAGLHKRRRSLGQVAKGVPSVIVTNALEASWDTLSKAAPEDIERYLVSVLAERQDDRALFLLAQLMSAREQWDATISYLQRIDTRSTYYLPSLLPLARALRATGAVNAAMRVLRANLDRVPRALMKEYAFELGALYEERGDVLSALEFYEMCGSLDWNFRDLQARIQRVRRAPDHRVGRFSDTEVPRTAQEALAEDGLQRVVTENAAQVIANQRTAAYDVITYIKYEFAPPADEVKKIFEFDLVRRFLDSRGITQGRTLDIGCATGRWPLWFSRQGFAATGFDVSDDSIMICRKRSQILGDSVVSFEKRNILDDNLPLGPFDLITCMMGTLNHIEGTLLSRFLGRVHEGLVSGGWFVFSVWNPQSPFVEFLTLDSSTAKARLRANALPADQLRACLQRSGWVDTHIEAFCGLPNVCYSAWDDEFVHPAQVVELDRLLRSKLSERQPQMFFVTCQRPSP